MDVKFAYRAEVWGKTTCLSRVYATKEGAIADCLAKAEAAKLRGIKQIAVTRWQQQGKEWVRVVTEGIERFSIADAKKMASKAHQKG